MSLLSLENARSFLVAGKAKLTLKSVKTGQHYTYRVTKMDDSAGFFVSLLTGGDDFSYIGLYFPNDDHKLVLTKKSAVQADHPAVAAFRFLLRCLFDVGVIPPSFEVRHAGECARCGRELTHPDSLDSGFGPECARRKTETRPRRFKLAAFDVTPGNKEQAA